MWRLFKQKRNLYLYHVFKRSAEISGLIIETLFDPRSAGAERGPAADDAAEPGQARPAERERGHPRRQCQRRRHGR